MTRWVLGLAVLAWVLGRLGVAGAVGLVADEAYYWCWSEQLAWGYFDHPPAIAAMIAAGTAALGHTELGVRGPGLALQGLAVVAVLWREGWPPVLTLVLLATPLLALGGVLATPDLPLVASWMLGTVAASEERWGLAGLACGAAMLSKMTGWLLWPCLVLGAGRLDRRALLSLGLALLVAAPNLAWNLDRGGGAFAFQLHHGLVGQGEAPGVLGGLELLLAQLGLVGPVLAVAAALRLWGAPRDGWWWGAVMPAAVFLPAACLAKAEANWMAPSTTCAVVVLARSAGRWRRAAEIGGWVAAAMSCIGLAQVFGAGAALERDPTDELYMGELIAQSAEAWGREPVLTARYQEAAWIRFYGGVDATTVPGVGRKDQFDLWPRRLPEATVFVRPLRRSEALATDELYAERGAAGVVVAHRGQRRVAAWQIVPVEGLIR